MIKVNRFFLTALMVVFLTSCSNVSQKESNNTSNNRLVQITPSVQQGKGDAVENTIAEVQTPKAESNQSQDVSNNTSKNQLVQITPSVQQEKDDAVAGAIMEVQTPKAESNQPEYEDHQKDNVAQVVNQVNEQISDNTGSYFLIQFKTTLNGSLRQQLADAGITLYDPLENNVYQAYIPSNALPLLEELLKQNEIISITTFPPQGKIKPPLNDPGQVNSSQSYHVTVQFFDAPTAAEKETLGKIMVVDEYAEGVMNFAQGHASGNDLRSIAELPFVKLIEEVFPASGGGGSQ